MKSLEQVHAGETVVDARWRPRVASSAAPAGQRGVLAGRAGGLSQRESEVLGLIVAGSVQPGHRERGL